MSIYNIMEDSHIKKTISLFVVYLMVISVAGVVFYFTSDTIAKGATTSDFDHWQEITISSAKVGKTLHDFPVLVFNNSWVIGLVSNDFTFFQPDNSTECNWELERYNTSTGQLIAWVNITSVSADTDTVFYIYWDDDGDGGENNPTKTWDKNYVTVFHMDGESTTEDDSSTYGRDGTIDDSNVNRSNGKIGYSQENQNDNGYIDIYDSYGIFDGAADFTIEAWVLNTNLGETDWFLKFGGECDIHIKVDGDDNNDDIYLRNLQGAAWVNIVYATSITADTWYHTAIAYDGDTGYNLYLDGVVDATNAEHGAIDGNNANNVIMNEDSASNGWDGRFDEFRISDIQRNSSWINAIYNNTNDPSTFLSFGETKRDTSPSVTMTDMSMTVEGQQSEIVYANSSGSEYQTGVMAIGILGTNYLERITINVSDIDDGNIDGDDIYVQFDNDNVSWSSNWLQCSDGGTSIIINGTEWDTNAYMNGANPFTADNDGDGYDEIQTNVSIYMKVKMVIPSGIVNTTYTNNAMTWDSGRYS